MKGAYLDALRERVLVFDGGMGTQIHARELTAADFGGERRLGCNDYLPITRPDVVEDIHAAYFEAGADVVETDSFQGSALRFAEWGLGERTLEITGRRPRSRGGWPTGSRRRMGGRVSSPGRWGPRGCCPPREFEPVPLADVLDWLKAREGRGLVKLTEQPGRK